MWSFRDYDNEPHVLEIIIPGTPGKTYYALDRSSIDSDDNARALVVNPSDWSISQTFINLGDVSFSIT